MEVRENYRAKPLGPNGGSTFGDKRGKILPGKLHGLYEFATSKSASPCSKPEIYMLGAPGFAYAECERKQHGDSISCLKSLRWMLKMLRVMI